MLIRYVYLGENIVNREWLGIEKKKKGIFVFKVYEYINEILKLLVFIFIGVEI